MNERLIQVICQQIEAINELTATLKNGSGGNISALPQKISALPQKLLFDDNGFATLDANSNRQGFIAVNKTDDIIYGIADQNEPSPDFFTWDIASADSEYYIPAEDAYTGEVNFVAMSPGSGYLMITEFSFTNG